MVTRMPKITRCTATQCAYNKDEHCHALGITVGDGECPLCDTAYPSAMKGGADNVEGSVGACRATDC
ncbi:MAG: DUF1540 domain-containing protein, partial [Clostridiales bacterium]|nr:DUF1540 domain-containing protein [Clostridiales bacterium]